MQAGFLGRKSGRGFYQYPDNPPANRPVTCAPEPAPSAIKLFGATPLASALAARLTRAGVPFEHLAEAPDNLVAACPQFGLYQTAGRTATAQAFLQGTADLVLVDLAFDPATATRLALASADHAEPGAIRAAAGLLQAAGYQVSVIDDIAGMIVLRTVAMLANEAADAVLQGVCTAPDCDLAMQKGVNYPRGPLAWCDILTAQTVVEALQHMLAATGETRYRVSPLLRRKARAGD